MTGVSEGQEDPVSEPVRKGTTLAFPLSELAILWGLSSREQTLSDLRFISVPRLLLGLQWSKAGTRTSGKLFQ